MNPEVAKFRIKGLDHCHKLDEIYRPVTATGARAWAPTSGELPPMYENCSTENDGDVGSDESEGDDLRGVSALDNITTNFGSGVGQKRVLKQGKKGKKLSAATKLSKQLDRICDAVESRTSVNSMRSDILGCSIQEVLNHMATMPECPRKSELFMLGTKLFIKKENREMFVGLGDDDTRLEWLKQEQRDRKAACSNCCGT